MSLDLNARLEIERLGARGEGVARTPRGLVFVPYALAGEKIRAEVDGDRGRLVEVLAPSPDRIAAFCPLFGTCGGCAVQTLAAPAYAAWKRGLLVDALANARVETNVRELVDAHGEGRRRVVFHARVDVRGKARIGFMQARAHNLVEIDACPLLAPALARAPAVAQAIADETRALNKPLDIAITATDAGLDVDLRGLGPLDEALRQRLVALCETLDLARLSNHGDTILAPRAPFLRMGRAIVQPPAGAFLQPTEAGERALAALVAEAAGDAAKIADLFAGVGTFSLRLAERAEVHAVEGDEAALAALSKAARATPGLRKVTTERRDLFRRPLAREEAQAFDALVFDPPRAGAEAQAKTLAQCDIPRVVAVSCNAQTFARDARLLVAGGYAFEWAAPVDQFRHSAHVEIVGLFTRAGRRKAKRSLLSR